MVEEITALQAEIALAEQDVTRIRVGQTVKLKARALPFVTFSAVVYRISPAATAGDVQSSVTVYCRLHATPEALRPSMTGYARIDTGRRPIGRILMDQVMRYVRTEFWW